MSLCKFLGGLTLIGVLREWLGNNETSAVRNKAAGTLSGGVAPEPGVASFVLSAGTRDHITTV